MLILLQLVRQAYYVTTVSTAFNIFGTTITLWRNVVATTNTTMTATTSPKLRYYYQNCVGMLVSLLLLERWNTHVDTNTIQLNTFVSITTTTTLSYYKGIYTDVVGESVFECLC